MADPRLQTLTGSNARIKTGVNTIPDLLQSVTDPLISVLCLWFATLLWGQPFGSAEMILGLIAFSLGYPGNVPFTHQQRKVLRRLFSQWALVAALLLLFGLAVGLLGQFNTNMLATWVVTTPGVQAVAHFLVPIGLKHVFALGGTQTAVIIGANELGRALARSLAADPYARTRVAAFFDDRQLHRLGDVTEAPISGRIERVADFIRANRTDQIFIALPMASQPRILKLLDELRDTTASIFFVPDIFMVDIIQARVDTIAGLPVVAICETPFHGTTGMIKRLSDLFIALAAVVVAAPVMLAVALTIKLTMPGPVLFRQRRYGLDGQEIIVWKFRSMKVAEDGEAVRQATKEDDRITPFGRFIRRTSLDELPQFFNVLSGQMSVVGPRPHAVVHNETYRKLIKGYMIRHKVKPGITGLAQVNGARGETETVEKMAKRIAFDLDYLRNWSLRLDIIIIGKTVLQAFGRDPNAY